MRQAFGELKLEFKPMLALAGPVVMAELGWMAMGIVDTIMVGRLGAEAIGAVSIGGILFFTVAIFGMGLLLGLDATIAQSFGAGDLPDCHRWLVHGVWLSLFLTLPLTIVVLLTIPLLPAWGIHPQVQEQIVPFLKSLTWSLLPLLLLTTFRRYLQAIGVVKPVMFALVSANLVNLAANWILIYGHLGAPAMGVEGSGWSTSLARIYLAVFLAVTIFYHDYRHRTGLLQISLKLETERLRQLMSLGLPAALQITLEIGVFAVATVLAGRLEPASLAAHQIALNLASVTFMVPLGVASAAAVRVGHAVGRGDATGAARSGWTALLLGASFMVCAGLIFVLFPTALMRIFTNESMVISIGISLLFAAALFQLFDGLQVVATGAMRGIGDTRTPMICNLVGHWLVGLPISYVLCFIAGWGVTGLWTGLSIGLIAVGAVLLGIWSRRIHSLGGHSHPFEISVRR